MARLPRVSLGLLLLGTPTLAACGSGDDAAAHEAATAFHAAVRSGDGAAACGLLARVTRQELEQSSGRRCEEAVLEEVGGEVGGPVVARPVRVFGAMAQVGLRGDTVFLTRSRDGWQVLAAACRPRPGAPYDCRVTGG